MKKLILTLMLMMSVLSFSYDLNKSDNYGFNKHIKEKGITTYETRGVDALMTYAKMNQKEYEELRLEITNAAIRDYGSYVTINKVNNVEISYTISMNGRAATCRVFKKGGKVYTEIFEAYANNPLIPIYKQTREFLEYE